MATKKLEPIKPPLIDTVYRNIGYKLTAARIWIFNYPSPIGGISWDRFITNDEIDVLLDKTACQALQESIMQLAIDRALAGQIVYSGDLRCRRRNPH